jgi:hypothetical protein
LPKNYTPSKSHQQAGHANNRFSWFDGSSRVRRLLNFVFGEGGSPMLRSLRRIAITVLLGLPGIGLAFLAKPLILGESTLLLGILLAFALPLVWLVATGSSPSEGPSGR